jgi:nucleoside-diphosphate-sugar epimerase
MFVQYSTCDVFGLKRRGPTGEDEPKKPQCAYSLSKLLSEFAALGVMRQPGLPVAVVRPTFVYGPGAVYTAGSFLVLPSLLSNYTDTIPLPAGGPRTNTIRVEDMANATLLVMEAGEKAAGRAFNVADDTDLAAYDFLKTVFAPFGINCVAGPSIPWRVVEVLGRIAERIPLRLFQLINGFLGHRWDGVVYREGLVPLLAPRIDRDFIGFLYGEHLYRNDRIKSLGFEPSYTTFGDGWPSTVQWYRDNGLIP